MLPSPLKKKVNSIRLLSPKSKHKKIKNEVNKNKKLINEAKKKKRKIKELQNKMNKLKQHIIKNSMEQVKIAKELQKLQMLQIS
jgi:seryl-tRNA synthetase